MILFDRGDARFNFRVAAVVYADDRVLLQREGEADFWFLPGGRVEMHETAAEALAREIREELGVTPHVQRLLWPVENFFVLGGVRFHELGLYFAVELPPEVPREGEFAGCETHLRAVLRWFPLTDLANVDVQPRFLREALPKPPAAPVHVIQRD